ncbi:hypothetical protein PPYR_10231 [Photinus pyralis]|uniref:Uncharacterized protein n=1 Tax=Photinus pyralis TaxID=7054 RepID=A0A5N4AFP8_PHOPY|nr:hypothetical protein PPYR_10231 [Photinus pyralis]
MTLGLIDHIIFHGSIAVSLCIGVYFGFWNKSQTADEYLLGNREMKILPVALSLVASLCSGVTLLGHSADVYLYGANIVWNCLSCFVASVIGFYFYVPVVMKLKTPNVFEYFGVELLALIHKPYPQSCAQSACSTPPLEDLKE